MRGQISIEYIAIVAFILFATVPVLYYATNPGISGPNEIVMKLGIFGSTNDIIKTTIAPSICKQDPFPLKKGTYRIFAEYVDEANCKVRISCGTGTCN